MFYLVLALSLIGSFSVLYDPNRYTLGNNLVKQPNFANPSCPTICMLTSIPVWGCAPNCQLSNITYICKGNGFPCSNNYTQGTYLDSTSVYTAITQTLTIEAQGSHLLSIEWMPQAGNSLGKQFYISLNGTPVLNVTCNASNLIYSYQKIEVLVELNAGSVELQLQMYGTAQIDGSGFFIAGVYLQKLIDTQILNGQVTEFNSYLNYLMENIPKIQGNTIPGSRVFLRKITNNIIALGRLRFYYFHRHNLTDYATTLLSNANSFYLDQGNQFEYLIQSCSLDVCAAVRNTYDAMLEDLSQKQKYTDNFTLSRNGSGLGFFSNNLDFFFYQIPAIFITYVMLALLFKILFNYRISKILRKYAFYGIFLLLVYEGNVENFTFFFFRQCKNLFSLNFSHKLANIFMIYFFFLVIVSSVGGLFFFIYHYKKLAKYFMEDSKQTNMKAALLESLEKSIYPLIFGSVHALLLDNLSLQTIILGIIQTTYLMVKIYALQSSTSKSKLKVCFMIVMSMLRMGFITTFYLYQRNDYPQIINSIHQKMVWSYVICWLFDFFCDLIDLMVELVSIIRMGCRKKENIVCQKKCKIKKQELNADQQKIKAIQEMKDKQKQSKRKISQMKQESNQCPIKIQVLQGKADTAKSSEQFSPMKKDQNINKKKAKSNFHPSSKPKQHKPHVKMAIKKYTQPKNENIFMMQNTSQIQEVI